MIFRELKRVGVNHSYGECLHRRGLNVVYLEKALIEEIRLRGFDQTAGKIFYDLLREYGLKGEWWYELDGTGYYLEGERGP